MLYQTASVRKALYYNLNYYLKLYTAIPQEVKTIFAEQRLFASERDHNSGQVFRWQSGLGELSEQSPTRNGAKTRNLQIYARLARLTKIVCRNIV